MAAGKKRTTVDGIECPKCLQRIWSRSVHDFRGCFCGYCFIDGGRDYLRIGYGDHTQWEPPFPVPKIVRIKP